MEAKRCKVCGGEWYGYGDICDKCIAVAFRERELPDAVNTIKKILSTFDDVDKAISKLYEIKTEILEAITENWEGRQ